MGRERGGMFSNQLAGRRQGPELTVGNPGGLKSSANVADKNKSFHAWGGGPLIQETGKGKKGCVQINAGGTIGVRTLEGKGVRRKKETFGILEGESRKKVSSVRLVPKSSTSRKGRSSGEGYKKGFLRLRRKRGQ